MKTVDFTTFLNARASLDPAGLVGIPEAYEATWMSDSSPYDGRVDRLVFEDARGIAARLAVLRPKHASEALFCFYGRRSDLEEATRNDLFSSLREWLDDQGITSVQGPVEFSTWHPYRFVCEQGPSPWFPGEQPMPDYWYRDFLDAGFWESACFASTLVQNLGQTIDSGLARGVDQGLSSLNINTVTGRDIVDLLPTHYDLFTSIFEDNYAYSAIEYAEFHALYSHIAALNAVLIVAADDQGPVGIAFSYNIGAYGAFDDAEPVLTSVFKTIGVHSRARGQRIGVGLTYLTHKHWLERGIEQIIHAYMKSDNLSHAMSACIGPTLREYALVRWSRSA
jgi:hypothetical protein